MYKKIFVVIDEHNYSETAANYGIQLAKHCNAKLYIFSCVKKGISRDFLIKIEEHINRVFLEATKLDIPVETIIEEGVFFDNMLKRIKKEDVDLLLCPLSPPHYSEITRFEKMLPISLALIRIVNMVKPHPANILLPLRGKMENIKEWARFISSISLAFRSKITILHIRKGKKKIDGSDVKFNLIDFHKNIPEDINLLVDYLENQGISIKKRFYHGKVSRSITIEAATKKNDLIVMGISKRGRLKKFLTEDPTYSVLKETPCNLIIFKPKEVL